MREIKFRAWTGTHILPVENLDWADDGLRPYINETTWANPNTLMQFTGLKDRHGIEIYEGDIVAEHPRMTANGSVDRRTLRRNAREVVWTSLVVDYEDDVYVGWSIRPTEAEIVEVIGNIYENPELLESEAKESK